MNILFMNSARAWGGNEKWVYLAASSLKGTNKAFLAYRHTIVGNRFSVEKIQLPFRHEVDVSTIAQLISFVRKNDIDILIPSKRKDYVIAGIVSRYCRCLNILRLGIVRGLKNSLVQSVIFNNLADGVIVNAEPIRDKLIESGLRHPEKVRVIYNGLNSDTISSLALKKFVKPPFTFTVTAMGELSPRKGLEMLIRGFALFLEISGAQNAGLVIIGEGAYKRTLQKLADSLKIEDKIIFTGFLENPYPYLANSQVFAMTSFNEGISNALLEAALLNNAIISTPSGGGIESVIRNGENGFLLEYGKDRQLATLLQQLYDHPELTEEIAEKASKTVAEMFSMERMTREILSFCNELQIQKRPA